MISAYGVRDERGSLAAASNLTRDRGSPPMVGVLTHPAHRGRGFASRAVRAATSVSVEADGLAGLRARIDDAGPGASALAGLRGVLRGARRPLTLTWG